MNITRNLIPEQIRFRFSNGDASRMLLKVGVFSLVFICGAISGYEPIAGLVIAASIGFCVMSYSRPTYFVYLYIFLVSLGGLLHLPVTDGGFSSAVAVALIAFCLIVFEYLVAKKRELITIPFGRIENILFLLFFCVMIISMKNSRGLSFSIKQIQQFTYLVVIYFFLQFAITEKKVLKISFIVLLLGAMLAAIAGLTEVALDAPFYSLLGNKSILGAILSKAFVDVHEQGRIVGLIGESIFHGMFMVILFVASMYLFIKKENIYLRILIAVPCLLAVLNIFGTGSRAVLLSLIIAIVIFWMMAEIRRKFLILTVTFTVIALIVVAMISIMPDVNVTRSFTYSEETSHTTEMRWENIPVAMKMFADHPVIGTGPDGFLINYSRYARNLTHLGSRKKLIRTHNTPLQVLAEYGSVGFVLFALILFYSMYRPFIIWKNHHSGSEDRLIAIVFISTIMAYSFFMLTANVILDKYFWLMIMLSHVHYGLASPDMATQRQDPDITE